MDGFMNCLGMGTMKVYHYDFRRESRRLKYENIMYSMIARRCGHRTRPIEFIPL